MHPPRCYLHLPDHLSSLDDARRRRTNQNSSPHAAALSLLLCRHDARHRPYSKSWIDRLCSLWRDFQIYRNPGYLRSLGYSRLCACWLLFGVNWKSLRPAVLYCDVGGYYDSLSRLALFTIPCSFSCELEPVVRLLRCDVATAFSRDERNGLSLQVQSTWYRSECTNRLRISCCCVSQVTSASGMGRARYSALAEMFE